MEGWHFSRSELATSYLDILSLGISSNLALIAPRRKGKTLFILQDLALHAQKKGFVPVYASLWQNINAPHEGLIAALEDAIAAIDKKAVFRKLLSAKIKRVAIGNELLGKVEVEFSNDPATPTNKELAYLDKLLSELEENAGKKTVLLLIDEVQHLATSNVFSSLSHSLRTMLDKRQGRVKTIFTGSSRHYMNLLLNEPVSPFYHFVESIQFPDLDEDFLLFLKQKLFSDHQVKVSLPALKRAFEQFDYSPYWMMKLIAQLIMSKASMTASLDYVLQLLEANEHFDDIGNRLKPIDRILFLTLCDGGNPFSKALMKRIDKETDVKGVQSNIQRSLQRLSEMHLISQLRKGEYTIEKPGLRTFLLKQRSN